MKQISGAGQRSHFLRNLSRLDTIMLGDAPGKAAGPFSLDPPQVFPSGSQEFINLVSHYYRGEMSRMMSWRDRIDRTTNWAIGAVAAMLSVSLSSPNAHHGVLLFAMLLVFLLLVIESRRYRFFDVYRNRVRLLERNYYARIFGRGEAVDPNEWMNRLSLDLLSPGFLINMEQALARRLRRNYIWLFVILLLAWVLKATQGAGLIEPGQSGPVPSLRSLSRNASLGHLPGWGVIVGLVLFYGWMLYVMIKHREKWGELAYGEVHV
ncbi:MAG TPA: DUF2270 domain-containing protein [Blastocatellia bacterium]|nr:DUF2270 domain-containing protein [Blastocatellia bacterium]